MLMDEQEISEPQRNTIHVPVMPKEIVEWIGEVSPRVIIDGTYGGGGHTHLLLDAVGPSGQVIALDRDPAVTARHEAHPSDPRITLYLGSYRKAGQALEASDLDCADAMILDLGLSSDQLADQDRGFSFTEVEAPLDLRFDPESGRSAAQWLASNREVDIADAIYRYGEERCSRRIAREIVARRRRENPVQSVGDLVEVCRRCVPRPKNHQIHPATRTFQALRIAVNDELGELEQTLKDIPNWIRPGGRIAIISFHSLEDRIVKNAFREDDRFAVLTRKPLRPSESEVRNNPRSRSAKLRVAAIAPDNTSDYYR